MNGLRRVADYLTGRTGVRVQLVAVLIIVQLAAQIVSLSVVASVLDFDQRREGVAINRADGFLTALNLLTPQALADDPAQLDRLLAADARFSLVRDLAPPGQGSLHARFAELVGAPWAERLAVVPLDQEGRWRGPPIDPFVLAVRLDGGTWLQFTPTQGLLAATLPYVLLTLTFAAVAVPLAMLAIWAGFALSAPIERLARGVDAFSRDIKSAPLEETGPLEVRRATAAFNRMQTRLRKLIDDRSQTLAAIGHDMRTPLTRLRLRLEGVDSGAERAGLEADLSLLERMIDDALRFMRAEGQQVRPVRTDLASACRTVCDEWADRGHELRYDGPLSLTARCDPDLMMRVLNNVVGNAAFHAGGGQVELTATQAGGIEIRVSDTGPGIDEAHRALVLEPFSRLKSVEAGGEGSGGGFGLGLAISLELMTRQGGTLRLAPNAPQGLIVVLELPAEAAG